MINRESGPAICVSTNPAKQIKSIIGESSFFFFFDDVFKHLQGCQFAKSRIVPVYKLGSQSLLPEEDTERHVCARYCY